MKKKKPAKTDEPKLPPPSKELVKEVEKTFEYAMDTFKKNKGFITMLHLSFDWLRKVEGGDVEQINDTGFVIALADERVVEARHHVVAGLGRVAALLELLGIAGRPKSIRIVSEAWQSEDTKKYARPALDPDRKEVLMVSAKEFAGGTAARMKNIERDAKDETKVSFSESKMTTEFNKKGTSISSPLLDRYFDNYVLARSAMVADGTYQVYRIAAQKDPNQVFQTAIKTAMAGALAGFLKENEEEAKVTKVETGSKTQAQAVKKKK